MMRCCSVRGCADFCSSSSVPMLVVIALYDAELHGVWEC